MLVSLIVALVLIGVVLYCLSLLPIDPTIQTLIRVVVLLFVVLWLLSVFGLIPGGHGRLWTGCP